MQTLRKSADGQLPFIFLQESMRDTLAESKSSFLDNF